MAAIEAAAKLQRRIKARDRYRRRRDRKIAVDWIGREFEYRQHDQLTGNIRPLALRITTYHPDTHMVRLVPVNARIIGDVLCSTDEFWHYMRAGILVQN